MTFATVHSPRCDSEPPKDVELDTNVVVRTFRSFSTAKVDPQPRNYNHSILLFSGLIVGFTPEWVGGDARRRSWSDYANHPQRAKLHRELIPQVRQFLQDKLPHYMMPAVFTVLEKLPHIHWALRMLIVRAMYIFILLLGLIVALSAANIDVTTVLTSLGVAGFALGFALYIPQFFGNQPIRVAHGFLVALGCIWLAWSMVRGQRSRS